MTGGPWVLVSPRYARARKATPNSQLEVKAVLVERSAFQRLLLAEAV